MARIVMYIAEQEMEFFRAIGCVFQTVQRCVYQDMLDIDVKKLFVLHHVDGTGHVRLQMIAVVSVAGQVPSASDAFRMQSVFMVVARSLVDVFVKTSGLDKIATCMSITVIVIILARIMQNVEMMLLEIIRVNVPLTSKAQIVKNFAVQQSVT